MQASHRLSQKKLLSPLVIALVLVAPYAFAKKDLFAEDPASKQAHPSEQLVTTPAPETKKEEAARETIKVEEHNKNTVADTKAANAEKETKKSYIEQQLLRLKGHLIEAKEDLFGSKKSAQKETPVIQSTAEPKAADTSHANEEAKPEIPVISATEAAQRAQALAEGQVINVRKYMEDEKPRYAIKLLQKNGRMKTINLDAVTGEQLEEIPE